MKHVGWVDSLNVGKVVRPNVDKNDARAYIFDETVGAGNVPDTHNSVTKSEYPFDMLGNVQVLRQQ